MFEKIRVSFIAVELNLLLWLVALGSAFSAQIHGWPLWTTIGGFLYAAIWQHQAYYRRKHDRQQSVTAKKDAEGSADRMNLAK